MGGITANLRGMMASIASIGDAADRVSIGVEALQGLQHGFQLAGIASDELNASLARFSRRVGEAVNGGGPLQSTLDRYGISVRRANGEVKSQIDLLREVADAVRNARTEQEGIAIAQAAFGDSGRRMVNALRGGAQGLDDMIRAAREAGVVLDESVVRQAVVIDRQFNELGQRLSAWFRRRVVDMALLIGLIRQAGELPECDLDTALQVLSEDVVTHLGRLETVSEATRAEIQGLLLEIAALAEESGGLAASLDQAALMMRGLGTETGTEAAAAFTDLAQRLREVVRQFQENEIDGEDFRAKLEEIAAEARTSVQAMDEMDQVRLAGVIGAVNTLLGRIAAIPGMVQQAERAMRTFTQVESFWDTDEDRFGAGRFAPTTSPRPRRPPPLLGEPEPPRASRGGGAAARQSEYARTTAAIRDQVQALELEATALVAAAASGREYADAISFARRQAELLHAAHRDGRDITPELRAEIDALAEAYVRAEREGRRALEPLERMRAVGDRVADALRSSFEGVFDDPERALENLKKKLLELVVKLALMRLLPGVFGAGGIMPMEFASGGYTGDGGTHEPKGVVHGGEFVFSKRAVQRIGRTHLEAMHRSARRGYARGGYVDDGAALVPWPAMGGGGQAAAPAVSVPVIVNNYGNQEVHAEEQNDGRGQRRVIMTVGEHVGAAVMQPGNPLRRSLMQGFGVKPRPTQR